MSLFFFFFYLVEESEGTVLVGEVADLGDWSDGTTHGVHRLERDHLGDGGVGRAQQLMQRASF